MEHYKGKKVLVVGLGKTGFALINFFNTLGCEVRVTDIKPIFDLNKQVKKLKAGIEIGDKKAITLSFKLPKYD